MTISGKINEVREFFRIKWTVEEQTNEKIIRFVYKHFEVPGSLLMTLSVIFMFFGFFGAPISIVRPLSLVCFILGTPLALACYMAVMTYRIEFRELDRRRSLKKCANLPFASQ